MERDSETGARCREVNCGREKWQCQGGAGTLSVEGKKGGVLRECNIGFTQEENFSRPWTGGREVLNVMGRGVAKSLELKF